MLEKTFILKSTELFKEIPGDLVAGITPFLKEVELGIGEMLFHKGDLEKSMYIIVEGSVRLHDAEHTFKVLKRGELIGELALLSKQTSLVSATAEEETLLYRLDQDIFYELILDKVELARILISRLTDNFIDFQTKT